jgi:molybdopterin synthase sulfur carrier subunit
MNVTVLFFASLREALGTGREAVALPAHVRTAGELREHLCARGPAWQSALGGTRPVRVAVDQVMAGPEALLAEGAEVAFFPPVTGG